MTLSRKRLARGAKLFAQRHLRGLASYLPPSFASAFFAAWFIAMPIHRPI